MGFSDIGCYGGEISTPNLDRLAAEGMRFTEFYNGARCCPTRAQLLTGLYAHQTGIGFMERSNGYNRHFDHFPEYQGFLNRNCVTLAEVLKRAGYQTFMTGKWHVGAEPGERPLDRGFDRFFGLFGGASSHFFPKDGQIILDDQALDTLPDDFYTTDAFSSYAARFIREAGKEAPLFLYLAYTAPHWPLHAWPEDIEKYRGRYDDGWRALREERFARQKAMGLFPATMSLPPAHPDALDWKDDTATDMPLRMEVYAAMIDRMDQGIGIVLEALKETGRASNTLILFMSDNGACAEPIGKHRPEAPPPDDPRSFQGVLLPWAHASNTPYRQFKHWTHNGGIRTPLVAWWPEGIPLEARGGFAHPPAHVIDIMPTVLDLAGARYPSHNGSHPVLPFEGQSMLPLLTGIGSFPERDLFWEHEGNRAIRSGRWKLVAHYNENLGDTNVALGKRSGRWELYDMEVDPLETNDLAAVHPETVESLAGKHAAWEKRIGVRDWETLLRFGGLDIINREP